MNGDVGPNCFRVKAEGRQRFSVKETWRQPDGILMGKVELLPEIDIGSLLKSTSRFLNCHRPLSNTINKRLLGASTPWPPFVYEMYDNERLMDIITGHLENWVLFSKSEKNEKPVHRSSNVQVSSAPVDNHSQSPGASGTSIITTRTSTLTMRTLEEDESDEEEDEKNATCSKAPRRPGEFSYWVAANLPLENSQRLDFLALNCPTQRLRWLISVLSKYTFLCCANCKTRICHRDDVFSMSRSGPQAAYVNPSGFVHETLTVYRVENLSLNGLRPSTEFSWFPGYAWTICSCSTCGDHIGWKFTAVNDKKLKPELFWGISRRALEIGLKTSGQGHEGDDEDGVPSDEWRPVI